ncbi:MAG: hypothetical protein A3C30_00890 [Candidatus Levybacteria bacterium RIFCSPHIGHO2_02_FULL_40_18]|nr:MAG: hypothetical protein A2869_03045 [Candidatus Levybacteria bacterium RIFCSPHIGHO2_01_FULL_40_58]OGH27254.1 MAG: hypothetical protein A3C30_00890 [Candidatus Levybacteria bacterium RIFCSPHIGHO2_02_FULL_40_18]OGH31113.1 MAG: hypothetical protein A3E43_05300 [Candidatus Levybacteria bacterium RIFCSPHIGHO2_12_FULL_40_31]OGH40719.1 MAG: hypothetical protein A2894_03140 [Candidatus Levybacteria bacterium RIFCSPLOWO2_01_FULL_40_64]OGH49358.1 MAG: hypothetical protein A3I54_01780 [Candidatus Lev
MPDRKLLTLLLVVFIDLLGFGVVIPILPILVENIGGDVFLVGVIISVFSFFQFLFSPIIGRLSDKYGRRPLLIITALINAASYILVFFFQSLLLLFIARIIAGVGSSNISVAQAYVADTSKSHERTKKMALMGAAFGLGFIFGPFIGGVISEAFGPNVPFIIPGVLSLINAVLIYTLLPESNRVLQKHIKIEFFNLRVTREVLRPKNMAFLLFLFFFVNLALALIIGIFPIFAQSRFGWNEAQNGYYFGLIGAGSFITQIYLIRLMLKRWDETQIIRIALLVFGVSTVFTGLAPIGLFMLIIGPLSSFSFSLLHVNVQSLISLESNPNEQGIVLGVAQSFGSLARVFGPLIGGIIASFDIGAPYIASGIVTLLILFFGYNYLHYMRMARSTNRQLS